MNKYVKLNLEEQRMFALTEGTLQEESRVGARIQSRANRAFTGHRVMETESMRAGRGLGNCLAQLFHLESACNAGDLGSIPGWGRSPGRGWLPTPVFLPGEFREQRSLEA